MWEMVEQNVPVSIDTCGSDYDTEIGVYTLVNGNLQLQANNDDSSFCLGGTTQSRVIFTFEEGVDYFIVVDGFNSGSAGEFNLNIDILPSPSPPSPPPPPLPPSPPPPPIPDGNGPDDAIVIAELPFETSGDSTFFTSTVGLGGGPDVFFAFTSNMTVRGAGSARKCVKDGLGITDGWSCW